MFNFLKDVLHIGTKIADGSIGDGVGREQQKEITKRGKALETAITQEFKRMGFIVVRNVYLPLKTKGEYTEIDVIAIGEKGVFIIESKNYNATIAGNIHDMYWKSVYKTGSYKLYSPLKQNMGHINHLVRVIKGFEKLPLYSYIIFPDTATIQLNNNGAGIPNTKVLRLQDIQRVTARIRPKLTKAQCRGIEKALKQYTDASLIKEIQQKRTVNKYKKR